jgi:hypothetical protein
MRYITRLAALFIVLSSLTSCSQKEGDIQFLCVGKDEHVFKPTSLNIGKYDVVGYKWEFDENMMYELCCGDQADWMKLTGVSAHTTTNHKNSFMCAFRWHTDGYWELGAYYHKNGEVFKPSSNPEIGSIKIYPNELGKASFETYINIHHPDRNSLSLTIISDDGNYFFEHVFDVTFSNVRIINIYFGGNQKAPYVLCVGREIIALQ